MSGPRGASVAHETVGDEAARILALATQLGALLGAQGRRVSAAESCTGGGIGFAITQVAGSSAWFDRGFITYANAAKVEMLGVPAPLIAAHGAVSEPVAAAMAAGALAHSAAQIAVAVTGIAGPGGGSRAKPVGTVCFAWAVQAAGAAAPSVGAATHRFAGDRAAVRTQSIIVALDGLIAVARGEPIAR